MREEKGTCDAPRASVVVVEPEVKCGLCGRPLPYTIAQTTAGATRSYMTCPCSAGGFCDPSRG